MARQREPRRPGPGRAEAGALPDLRLPVWQFVRLMVQVEETLAQRPDPAATKLSKAWSDVWSELDAELAGLGETDSQAFADLMMDQEVVLEAVSPDLSRAVEQLLTRVVRTMRASLKVAPKEEQRAEDLRFEVAELEKTLKTLPTA